MKRRKNLSPWMKQTSMKAAHCIKDNPTLHLALGLTEPYWASMALAVGVQKLHEYQTHKNHRKQSQVLSCGKLATHY